MFEDSRTDKGEYHEVWIDHSYQYHLCRNCYTMFMEDVLRRTWCEDEQQWTEKSIFQ